MYERGGKRGAGAYDTGAGAAAHGWPGKRTQTALVQRRAAPGTATAVQAGAASGPERAGGDVHDAAQAGVGGAGGPLPHLDRIQAAFGREHDLSGVTAHVGGAAADACDGIGASAYASGSQVAFHSAPDLHTAAHEAAHVVQQRGGVSLYGGVGEAGDSYERNADAVADRVVAGQPAGDLLAPFAGGAGKGRAVQRLKVPGFRILGVLITPNCGPAEFEALEKQLLPSVVSDLHKAAKRGAESVITLLQGYVPEETTGNQLLLLREFAARYVKWVKAPKQHPMDPRLSKAFDDDGRFIGWKNFDHAGGAHVDAMGKTPTLFDGLWLNGKHDLQVAVFKFVVITEGGPAAINAYDDQSFTIGCGWSAASKNAGKVYNAMPQQFRDRLAEHGIDVKLDGSFRVTEADGDVLEGKDAIRAISKDPHKLSLLIAAADSQEKIDGRTTQDWMVRAQFSLFAETLKPHWAEVQNWPPGVLMVAYKMFHWQQGICGWGYLKTWYKGGPDYMFNKIRTTIVDHYAPKKIDDYSDVNVTGRMDDRAAKARNRGYPVTIVWDPPVQH